MSRAYESGCVLLHRILTQGIAIPTSTAEPLADLIRISVRALPYTHVLSDDVQRLSEGDIYEPKTRWASSRPPFDDMWIECPCVGGRVGAHIITGKPEDDEHGENVASAFVLFVQLHGSAAVEAAGLIRLVIAPDGEIKGRQANTLFPARNEIEQHSLVAHVLDVIELANDPSVDLVEVQQSRLIRKMLEKQFGQREGGYRYNVIMLKDEAKRYRKANPTGERKGVMPLTVQKGHYAYYGQKYGKGKLFGLYEGKVFKPECERGDAANGVIDHGYRLEASRTMRLKPLAVGNPVPPIAVAFDGRHAHA